MEKAFLILFLSAGCFLIVGVHPAFANNLSITNVSMEDRNSSLDTAIIEFDINWDNSWRNTTNHDAVWVFFKVTKSASVYHGMMKDSGVDPVDTSPGSNKDLEIYVPTDKMGAFIRRKSTGTGTVTSKDVRLKLDYAASPLSASDSTSLTVKVIGLEMVFIPTAAFHAGDTTSTYAFGDGTGTNNPWYITSESTITTSSSGANRYYYTSAAQPDEDASGSIFTIPAAFPKGYAAFYCMKYELTEGAWVDFINSLSAAAQTNRDITSNQTTPIAYGGKNSQGIVARNTVTQSGSGTSAAATTRPNRVVGYVSWEDLCAYLDWVGLRPMTELEFEKAARGPLTPVPGEYAWGSTNITAAVTFSGSPEDGNETITTANANANYNYRTFSRGDDYLGSQSASGPMRAGIFATASSTREQAGASYYGVMEMSGNIEEHVITVGNSAGRAFTGLNGDGVLSTTSSYEGNANVTNWPHTDAAVSSRGVTKADGSGRVPGWTDTISSEMAVSLRIYRTNVLTVRSATTGGRGVRTYDGP